MNTTAGRFRSLCNACERPLWYIGRYKVCPRGCGRLIPSNREERRTPEARARRIVAAKVRCMPRGLLFAY